MKMKSFALYEMDIKLEKYLKDIENGFFVEAGANNGITQSNTYRLELYYGWTGLLVEAVPERAKICSENRPDCITENVALVSREYRYSDIEITYCKQKQGMMSIVEGAKSGNDLAEHLHNAGETEEEETVFAMTLSKVLSKHKITKIDFLSLDVEGYESQVLKGLFFSIWKPTYILVEENDDKVEPILTPLYDKIDQLSHHDYLYKLK